jgi:hypothetical protein
MKPSNIALSIFYISFLAYVLWYAITIDCFPVLGGGICLLFIITVLGAFDEEPKPEKPKKVKG